MKHIDIKNTYFIPYILIKAKSSQNSVGNSIENSFKIQNIPVDIKYKAPVIKLFKLNGEPYKTCTVNVKDCITDESNDNLSDNVELRIELNNTYDLDILVKELVKKKLIKIKSASSINTSSDYNSNSNNSSSVNYKDNIKSSILQSSPSFSALNSQSNTASLSNSSNATYFSVGYLEDLGKFILTTDVTYKRSIEYNKITNDQHHLTVNIPSTHKLNGSPVLKCSIMDEPIKKDKDNRDRSYGQYSNEGVVNLIENKNDTTKNGMYN